MVIATLNALGVGRQDRVAIVLPNGPEMAVAFLAVACGCDRGAPQPRLPRGGVRLLPRRPRARRLLIVQAGIETRRPSRSRRSARGIPVIELSRRAGGSRPASSRSLRRCPAASSARRSGAQADDVALVLHTSGTTSRPKIVPLTHSATSAASAAHIRATLALTPADRCLNIMPLFHIHGLIAAVLVVARCRRSGRSARRASTRSDSFSWLEECQPTWYTAVPTMHQAILARAERNARGRRPRASCGFIRSSSASLPPQVMAELEATFGCPVIEAYGMTEATHQMASNPLPPRAAQARLGRASPPGREVAIMDERRQRCCRPGEIGEIVIRGPNVTPRLREQPDGQRRRLHAERLVPHRRPGHARRATAISASPAG